MNRKVVLCVWIAVISIVQLLIDKVFFPENEKFERRESELYQPMSELQYKQQQVIREIRDKNYLSQLSPDFGKQTVDQKYMDTLLNYHREMINLYEITTSRTLLFAIAEMSSDVAKMSTNTNEFCIKGEQKDEFLKATNAIIPLAEKMLATKTRMLDFDARVRAAKPDHDEKGNMVVEEAAEHLKMIFELMKEPDLLVRFKADESPLQDIDKFVGYYNVIHLAYGECSRVYQDKNDSSENWKLFWQILSFLLLTVGVYKKDLL